MAARTSRVAVSGIDACGGIGSLIRSSWRKRSTSTYALPQYARAIRRFPCEGRQKRAPKFSASACQPDSGQLIVRCSLTAPRSVSHTCVYCIGCGLGSRMTTLKSHSALPVNYLQMSKTDIWAEYDDYTPRGNRLFHSHRERTLVGLRADR